MNNMEVGGYNRKCVDKLRLDVNALLENHPCARVYKNCLKDLLQP